MKDIMYVNDFMRVYLPCTIYNIDLSVLPLKSFVKDVIKYINNNGASEYFLVNRRTIDQSVIEQLLIYQPDYSDGQDVYSDGRDIYSYIIGMLLERLPHVSGLIENTWEISELIEPDTRDILEEQLFNYYHSWILPTLNKTLYTQFQKDLYGLNFIYELKYIERNKDFEFFLPDQDEIQNVWKDVWSIENINCRISNSFARSDFLVLTIMKAN